MRLLTRSRFLAGLAFTALALACGMAVAGQIEALTAHVPDKVDFDAAKNAAVRKIAILHINPTHHFVVENASLMGAAFPGLVELSVESGVNGSHARKYIEAMNEKSVNFIAPLVDALQEELRADGYEVSYLQQGPRLKEDKKTLDYSGIHGDADAYLTVWYGKTGYWSPTNKPDFAPTIIMGVKLTDAHTFETLFFKTMDITPIAGQVTNANVEAISPDARYSYATFDRLMASFDESVQGLLDSEGLIAVHVAQHLKPAALPAATPAASAASNP